MDSINTGNVTFDIPLSGEGQVWLDYTIMVLTPTIEKELIRYHGEGRWMKKGKLRDTAK